MSRRFRPAPDAALLTRRRALALAASVAGAALPGEALAQVAWRSEVADGFLAALEERLGGRIGVSALDLSSGRGLAWRADERFPLLSVFKLYAAALALSHVDRGADVLSARIPVAQEALVENSPVTSTQIGGDGMTLAAVCDAAVTRSDNAAGNLLLARFGGPEGLTAFARSLGDIETRLDRIEPDLNHVAPGDPRDTTTPNAVIVALRALLFGDALTQASRIQLHDWLAASATGDARLRAGFPAGWNVGEKTGTASDAAADVGFAQVPDGRTTLIAVFLAGGAAARRDATFADVARLAAVAFG